MSGELLLAVDIGNTNVSLTLMDELTAVGTASVPSRTVDGPGLSAAMRDLFRTAGAHTVAGAAVVSVLLLTDAWVISAVAATVGFPPWIVNHRHFAAPDAAVPRDGYAVAGMVGLDRLVVAVGAVAKAGFPVVTADIGTAVTVDTVAADADGLPVFLGGAILPGPTAWIASLRSSAEGLARPADPVSSHETAPWFVPGPTPGICSSTDACIRTGLRHGLAGALDRLLEQARIQIGRPECPCLLTGGGAGVVAGLSGGFTRIEPHLCAIGMAILHRRIVGNDGRGGRGL